MKVAIFSTFVPFIYGGGRNIVDWLATKLQEFGFSTEVIYLPSNYTPNLILQQMACFRAIDLSSADRVICIRPQAHVISHPNKVLWFIHHLREYYDLWNDDGNLDHLEDFKFSLIDTDTSALREAKKIYTNSQVISDRLKKFNGISNAKILYPPIFQPEIYSLAGFNDEIVYVGRVEPHKRQELLIRALALTKTEVKLRIIGATSNPAYFKDLTALIATLGITERVAFNNVWMPESEKVKFLSECLATAYLPLDEDSYGYPSLESSHSSKPILTTIDSGGVLELVSDGINGYVTEPDPKALADAMDQLFSDRKATRLMGLNAQFRLKELSISWENVVHELTT
jgi:glycosyltransferase involved in cell wall biosynthesis